MSAIRAKYYMIKRGKRISEGIEEVASKGYKNILVHLAEDLKEELQTYTHVYQVLGIDPDKELQQYVREQGAELYKAYSLDDFKEKIKEYIESDIENLLESSGSGSRVDDCIEQRFKLVQDSPHIHVPYELRKRFVKSEEYAKQLQERYLNHIDSHVSQSNPELSGMQGLISESNPSTVEEIESLTKEYSGKYGRTVQELEKMFTHLLEEADIDKGKELYSLIQEEHAKFQASKFKYASTRWDNVVELIPHVIESPKRFRSMVASGKEPEFREVPAGRPGPLGVPYMGGSDSGGLMEKAFRAKYFKDFSGFK